MKLLKKITTRRIAEANRANAKKSTGPRTAQGIVNSSRNALKHGILAEKLPPGLKELGEDASEFEQLRDGLRNTFRPGDELENLLVNDMANIRWRLTRSLRAEAQLQVERRHEVGTQPHRDTALLLPENDLTRVIRYEGHLRGQFWNMFRAIIAYRRAAGGPLAVAVDLLEGQPTLPNELTGNATGSCTEKGPDEEATRRPDKDQENETKPLAS